MEDKDIILEEYSLGDLSDYLQITLDNEVGQKDSEIIKRIYTVEFIQRPVDILKEDEIGSAEMAWHAAVTFWKRLFENRESEKTLEEIMSEQNDIKLNKKWTDVQFDALNGNENITNEQVGSDNVFSLDWTKLKPVINVKEENPKVSPQLTAGASLLALENVFLITQEQLTKTDSTDSISERITQNGISKPKDKTDLAEKESTALIQLIERIIGTMDTTSTPQRRYMKEYIGFMPRTSLDVIYSNMTDEGQELFKEDCLFFFEDSEYSLGLLELKPDQPIFKGSAEKESDAEKITIKELLLSIIKYKEKETDSSLEYDPNAAKGDAFSQAGLAGISEINPDKQEGIARFGLSNAGEMMRGEPGIIFENRMADLVPLSQMPNLFNDIAHGLIFLEGAFEGQLTPQESTQEIPDETK